MAEKIIYEIKVDSQDAINSIDGVNNSVTDLDKSFEDVYGDIKPLTNRLGELEDRLYQLAQAGDTTSKEFKDLTAEAGRLVHAQDKVTRTVDNAAKSLGGKLSGAARGAAGALEVAAGSMALVGVDSENADKAIQGVVGAMAVTDGLETMKESAEAVKGLGTWIKSTTAFQKIATAAQWLWNIALNANPIGLIVIAVTALIAAGYGLVKLFSIMTSKTEDTTGALNDNSKALDNQAKAQKKATKDAKDAATQAIALAKAQGKSKEEIRKLEKAIVSKTITDAEALVMTNKKIKAQNEHTLAVLKGRGASEEEIKLAEDNLKKSKTILSQSITDKDTAHQEQKALTNRYAVEDAQAATDAQKLIEQGKEDAKLTAAEKRKKKEDDEKKAKEKKESDEAIAKEKKIKDDAEKEQSALNAVNDIRNADKIKREDEEAVSEEAKIVLEGERQIAKLERLQIGLDQEGAAYKAIAAQIEATRSEYEGKAKEGKDKDGDNDKKREKLLRNQKLNDAKSTLGDIASLAKEGSAIGKAAAIAQATISGVQGVQNAYTTAQSSPITALFPAYPLIQAGLAGAISLKNIAAIKKGTTPSKAGGGGPNGTPTPTAPTFNVVGQSPASSSDISTQTQTQNDNNDNNPIRAYVVSTEVTSQQALDRSIESDGSIG